MTKLNAVRQQVLEDFLENPAEMWRLANALSPSLHRALVEAVAKMSASHVVQYLDVVAPPKTKGDETALNRPAWGCELADAWIATNPVGTLEMVAPSAAALCEANGDSARAAWWRAQCHAAAEPQHEVTGPTVPVSGLEAALSAPATMITVMVEGADDVAKLGRVLQSQSHHLQVLHIRQSMALIDALESFDGVNRAPSDDDASILFEAFVPLESLTLEGFGLLEHLALPHLKHLHLIGQPAYRLFENPRTKLDGLVSLKWDHPVDRHDIAIDASELEALFTNAQLPNLERLDLTSFALDNALEEQAFFRGSSLPSQAAILL